MNSLVIIGLLAGIPIVLGLLFRVSAMLLYLSLAIGFLLVQFLGDDAGLAAGAFARGPSTDEYTNLALLLTPVAITLLLARKSASAAQLLVNVPLLVMTGLAVAVIAVPMLPNHIETQIYATQAGNALRQTQDDIIGITGLGMLAFVWATHRHKGHRKKHH